MFKTLRERAMQEGGRIERFEPTEIILYQNEKIHVRFS